MKEYLDLVQKVWRRGEHRSDRTGVGTRSLFGEQLRVDLQDGFPILTTKQVWFKGVVCELLWFLRAEETIHYLRVHKVGIWDEWADEKLRVGPVYGKQWREWEARRRNECAWIDQLETAINLLRDDPTSRRILVSAWNVADLQQMALPPCHVLFQFYSHEPTTPEGPRWLSCHMYQRSADLFIGVPFNLASYALLTHVVAQLTGHMVGELVISFGDVHLYANHAEQVEVQLAREPLLLPELEMNKDVRHIDGFAPGDFKLRGYEHHPAIKAPIAV